MAEINEINIREHDQIAGVKRVTLFPATAKRMIDAVDSSTTYVGVAAPGTSTSDTKAWLLEKIVTASTITTITHATDSWDNRLVANYS
jgi:predicted component of type VI protein secretion system